MRGKIMMFVGNSRSHEQVCGLIERVKDSNVPVFILGESGTGKELVARTIHASGNRRSHRFIAVNCGAIPEHLLESELFGYVKGAFTGAIRNRPGLIEEAEGGTFFLDEIGDLSHHLQAKLLRLLQEKEIRRIGENHVRPVRVRFISATNKNIEEEIQAGRFREDLYYRLKIISITLSPLRERKEEIPFLLSHFLKKYRREMNLEEVRFSSRAMGFLVSYSWPGNIRELQNEVQRCLVLRGDHSVIDAAYLSSKITREKMRCPHLYSFFHARDEFERNYIHEALRRCDFHRKRTAEDLGLSRQGLFKLIKKHNIEIPRSSGRNQTE